MSHLIEVAARGKSVEEARTQVRTQLPPNAGVVLETIESDVAPGVAEGKGATADAAFEDARSHVPVGSEVVSRNDSPLTLSTRTIVVDAYDEPAVRAEAAKQLRAGELTHAVRVLWRGSSGFLGIGRRPNRYVVEIRQPGFAAKIRYQGDAQLRAWIGSPRLIPVITAMKTMQQVAAPSSGRCRGCGKDLDRGDLRFESADGDLRCQRCVNLLLGQEVDWPEPDTAMRQETDNLVKIIETRTQSDESVSYRFHSLAHLFDMLEAPDSARLRATEQLIGFANAHNKQRMSELYPGEFKLTGARAETAMALAVLNTQLGVDELIRWLTDWSDITRQEVAFALGTTGSPQGVEPLTTVALNDPARINLGDPLGHPGHYKVRFAATIGLLWIHDASVRQAFSRFPATHWTAFNEYIQKQSSLVDLPGFCESCKRPDWWTTRTNIRENLTRLANTARSGNLDV